MMKLEGISSAAGLSGEHSALLKRLVRVLGDHMASNKKRLDYYEDKNPLKNLGLAVPPQFEGRVDTSIGWAAKACDFLSARSLFDEFASADPDTYETLLRISKDNDLAGEYAMAVPAELQHGCGFWTVTKGGPGEQDVVINFHDAMSAAAVWDWRHKRILAGMVIEDYAPVSDTSNELEPSLVVLHTSDAVVEIERVAGDTWAAVTKPHPMGRPLMEAMSYRPSNCKPFGKSRITRTVMALTDEMQREVIRTAIHSECFSAPQKYMLGASDEAFDVEKFKLAYNSFMLVSKDTDGDVPTVGQFAQASMEPHIRAMESLMARISSETAIPVTEFGISTHYQSSDALRASTDSLILEAESLNATNGKALRNVAKMALAIAGNKTLEELTEAEQGFTVHWVDPSMPSVASVSDALVKQAGVVDWLPETTLFWEKLGYSEDERARLMAEKGKAQAAVNFAALIADGGAVADDAA